MIMTYFKSILSFLILSVLFISCSSDDSSDSSDEISPVVGIWSLTELNINIAQDPNEDGTASTNMVDELPCITGVININASGTWTATITVVNITPVTGDFYVVRCSETISYSGNYIFTNNQLNLNDSSFSAFSLSGTTLTENLGDNLPGVLNYKYEKQ